MNESESPFELPICAHIYRGREILDTVTIDHDPEADRPYTIDTTTGRLTATTETLYMALKIASTYLEEHIERANQPDSAESAAPEGNRRDRVDDQGTTEGGRPDR